MRTPFKETFDATPMFAPVLRAATATNAPIGDADSGYASDAERTDRHRQPTGCSGAARPCSGGVRRKGALHRPLPLLRAARAPLRATVHVAVLVLVCSLGTVDERRSTWGHGLRWGDLRDPASAAV